MTGLKDRLDLGIYAKVAILLALIGIVFLLSGYYIELTGFTCYSSGLCLVSHSYQGFYAIGATLFLPAFLAAALDREKQTASKNNKSSISSSAAGK
jgi:hypothetical protein